MPHAPSPADLARVGPYAVRARLGSGPVGTVYRAIGPDDRLVAVKVIHGHLMAVPGFRARLAAAAGVACTVPRRRTVPIVALDLAGDPAWIARPWVPGRTLDAELSRREVLLMPQVTWLAIGLAEGLAALHQAGIVHRGLKPSNVIIARYGPRITDFCTSAALRPDTFAETDLASGPAQFLAPEQVRGREAGPASDIFSLGAVLAYAARGAGLLADHEGPAWHQATYGEPDLAGVPDELRPLIEQCLSPHPERRPTARQAKDALTHAELIPARLAPMARPLPRMPPVTRETADDRATIARQVPVAMPSAVTGMPAARDRQPPTRGKRTRGMRLVRRVVLAGAGVLLAVVGGLVALAGILALISLGTVGFFIVGLCFAVLVLWGCKNV